MQLPYEGFTSSSKLCKKIPDNYMQSIEVQGQFDSVLDQLNSASSIDEINAAYSHFCDIIDSELITYRKSKHLHKPWWNRDLSV